MLLLESDISKQDLCNLNTMNLNFHGIGESTVDLNDRIVCGRIPGGFASFWKVEYDPIIRPLRLNVDWVIGIE